MGCPREMPKFDAVSLGSGCSPCEMPTFDMSSLDLDAVLVKCRNSTRFSLALDAVLVKRSYSIRSPLPLSVLVTPLGIPQLLSAFLSFTKTCPHFSRRRSWRCDTRTLMVYINYIVHCTYMVQRYIAHVCSDCTHCTGILKDQCYIICTVM